MMEEREIIAAIQSGKNQWVLNVLYERTLPKIKAHIRKMNGIEDDALDIFQEAVIILFRQVKMNRIQEISNLDGFMFRISRNLYLNKLRSKKQFVDINEHVGSSSEPEVESHIFLQESEEKLMSLFSKIGDKCRDLLRVLIFESLNYEEAALKLGMASSDVVKTQKYRCKKKLEELLEQNPAMFEGLKRFSV